MATVEELKDIIVDLKMELIRVSIPEICCPYSIYKSIENPLKDPCGEIDCCKCKDTFFYKMKEKIVKEVNEI